MNKNVLYLEAKKKEERVLYLEAKKKKKDLYLQAKKKEERDLYLEAEKKKRVLSLQAKKKRRALYLTLVILSMLIGLTAASFNGNKTVYTQQEVSDVLEHETEHVYQITMLPNNSYLLDPMIEYLLVESCSNGGTRIYYYKVKDVELGIVTFLFEDPLSDGDSIIFNACPEREMNEEVVGSIHINDGDVIIELD